MEFIKSLTGEDKIVVENKYQNSFSYRPQAKLIMSTNDPLRLTEHGAAIRRRLRMIPFDYTPTEPDGTLEAKLEPEAPQILSKLTGYAVRWYNNGLPHCSIVEATSKDFIDNQDTIGQFIAECVVQEAGAICGKTEMYKAYKAWEEDRGTEKRFIPTNRSFWTRADMLYAHRHAMTGAIYEGIKIRT
jgi:putative DNA primase/helicase